MPLRNDILSHIDNLLNVSEYEDYCHNGLQVEGTTKIQKIVTGVSVSARLFSEAIREQAEMIIVHHGLFWKNDPAPFSLTGFNRHRIALLIKHDINLAGYHLPLDAHGDIGNNSAILNALDFTIEQPVDVGFIGCPQNPISFTELCSLVDQKLGSSSIPFPFGPDEVKKMFVISGGGAFYYKLAVEHGADTFLTGEIREPVVRLAEEHNLNFIVGGHYNTEKLGIQLLGQQIEEKFKIPCKFIDIPNPV